MLRDESRSIFEKGPAFARRLSSGGAFGHGYLAMEIAEHRDSESRKRLYLLTLSMPIHMGHRAAQRFYATSERVADQLSQVGMLHDIGDVISTCGLPSDSLGNPRTFRALLQTLRGSV